MLLLLHPDYVYSSSVLKKLVFFIEHKNYGPFTIGGVRTIFETTKTKIKKYYKDAVLAINASKLLKIGLQNLHHNHAAIIAGNKIARRFVEIIYKNNKNFCYLDPAHEIFFCNPKDCEPTVFFNIKKSLYPIKSISKLNANCFLSLTPFRYGLKNLSLFNNKNKKNELLLFLRDSFILEEPNSHYERKPFISNSLSLKNCNFTKLYNETIKEIIQNGS